MANPGYQQPPTVPYQAARDTLNAIERLQGILERDDLTPEQRQRAETGLAQLQQRQGAATQAAGEGGAMWRGVRQGATFNLADELANVPALFNDNDYAAGLEESRALDMQAQREYPDEFAGGELSGAVVSSLMPMSWAARGATLPAQMARGTVAGAAVGGGAQFGRGEGGDGTPIDQFLNRAGPAVPQAAIGAALGGLAPAAGTMAGATARALMGGAERLPGVSNRAASTMARAFRRHEASDPQPVIDYLASLGREGTLSDVPGALQRTAMGVASMPGAGGNVVARALEERAQGASARISDTADAVLGPGTSAAATRTAQEGVRANVGGPMYDAALAAPGPVDITELHARIQAIAGDAGPSTAAALRRFVPTGQVAGGGAEDAIRTMSAAQLHGYRSDLSDAAQAARQAGNSKQAAALSRALEEFDSALDSVPGYAAARAAYAESFAVTRAADEGRAALAGGATTSQTPAQVREMFSGMTPAQQEAYRQGVREYVYAQMGTARNAPATAWADLSRQWTREKLETILGADEAARIFDRLNAERVFSDTRGRVTRGSDTAGRVEAAADLGDIRAPDSNRRPGPVSRIRDAANEGVNTALDAVFPGRAAANLDVGRILSAQGPERDRLVQLLLAQAARSPQTATQRYIATALTAGLPAGGLAQLQASQERR